MKFQRNDPATLLCRVLEATEFGMWLYLEGLYHVILNYSPGVKFDPAARVTRFTRAYEAETLEIFLYLVMRPRIIKFCMWLYLGSHYQVPKLYSLGQIGLHPQGSQDSLLIYGKLKRSPCT